MFVMLSCITKDTRTNVCNLKLSHYRTDTKGTGSGYNGYNLAINTYKFYVKSLNIILYPRTGGVMS